MPILVLLVGSALHICFVLFVFFLQAEVCIRDLVRSRGLGDVYKRQIDGRLMKVLQHMAPYGPGNMRPVFLTRGVKDKGRARIVGCLLYTSDAADERSSVDLGGRRIIKKKNSSDHRSRE